MFVKKGLMLLLYSCVFLPIFLILVPKAWAQTQNELVTFEQDVFDTDDSHNQPKHAHGNIGNISGSLVNRIMGCVTEACQRKQDEASGGAVGSINDLIVVLYSTPPASSAYYLADLGQRLNIVQPAYAQGIGFSGLQPLLPLWRAVRNIAYIFFIFVFIFIGFAIMFRAKINPQVVVTLQSAIPKATVALILVTFSYAIAGLMIDLMYLITGLSLYVLSNVAGAHLFRDIPAYFTASFGDLFHDVWSPMYGNIREVLGGLLPWTGGTLAVSVVAGFMPAILMGAGGWLLALATAGPALVFILLAALVFLFIVIKIFFAVVKAYFGVIISVLIGPLQLMLSAVPGQNTFGAWMKGLLSNLLVFPTVTIMLVLANFLAQTTENLWVPPMLGAFGASTGEVAGSIIGLCFVFATPKAADIIKSMFDRKPFNYGGAVGEAMTPISSGMKTYGVYRGATMARHLKRIGRAGTPQADWKATAGAVLERGLGVKQ